MDVTFDHVGALLILDLMMRLNDGRNRFSIQGRIVDLNFAFMDETIRRNRASGGKKYQIPRNKLFSIQFQLFPIANANSLWLQGTF